MPRGAGRRRGAWGAFLTQPVGTPGMWLSFLWDEGRRWAGGILGWGAGAWLCWNCSAPYVTSRFPGPSKSESPRQGIGRGRWRAASALDTSPRQLLGSGSGDTRTAGNISRFEARA